MANQLAKDLELMWESVVTSYDSMCVISREAATSFPSPQAMQRAGDTFYKRQNYETSVTTGLDLTSATPTDVLDRFVPTVYRSPDNVSYFLDAKEMRDPDTMRMMGEAAARKLAGEVDKNLYSACAANAGIVVKKTTALDWTHGAEAEALLLSRGYTGGDRKLFMNPFDYVAVAKDLGNRQYQAGVNLDAYENSKVPDIANFKTFRTDNQARKVAIGTVSGTTVNGNQSYTVTSMTGDVPTDNRKWTLTVQGSNVGNIKVGDVFTIAGINAVHGIDKSDTGQPLTFTVLAIGGGGTQLTVNNPVVITGPYQNATAQAANGAALTFLNTVSAPVNVFWEQGAVTLDYGRLAFPTDQGAKVMTSNTKQGVPLIATYQFNAITGKTFVRFTTLYAASVLDPARVGLILANQS